MISINKEKLNELLDSGGIVEHGWQAFIEAFHVPDDQFIRERLQEAFFLGTIHAITTLTVAMSVDEEEVFHKAFDQMFKEAVRFATGRDEEQKKRRKVKH